MTLTAHAPATRISRVVLWGTCDTGKPRVRILRDGLRANGVEVIECRSDIWGGVEDKSQIKGIAHWLRLLLQIAFAYPALIVRYLRLPKHDWVLLGYPAVPDIFVIRVFAWLRRTPIAMDWFLSAYDTVVLDRKMVGRRHPLACLLWLVEALAVRLADCVFMDTRSHAARMDRLFRLPPGYCKSVWVGVEDIFFYARPGTGTTTEPDSGTRRVLFYGQFIPLHGTPVIIHAARKLRDRPIQWLLVGQGQDAAKIREMLDEDPLPQVTWRKWVPYHELLGYIRAADVCLGIFGTSDKAASVIPNKAYQVLAAGKPLITRDSPAIRELLDSAPIAATLIPADDPTALANAVAQPLPERRTPEALATLENAISAQAIGLQLARLLATQRGDTDDEH